jgi:hypothetical protein
MDVNFGVGRPMFSAASPGENSKLNRTRQKNSKFGEIWRYLYIIGEFLHI